MNSQPQGTDLISVVDFIYHGEVEVEKDSLYDFLAIGEKLKLKGLAKTPEHSASQVIISFSLFVHVASNYHPHHLSKA